MELRQSLFWDTDPSKIDLEKNAKYIIERVLDFGKDEEVRWLVSRYPQARIKETVLKSRSLRPQTKKLWTLVFAH